MTSSPERSIDPGVHLPRARVRGGLPARRRATGLLLACVALLALAPGCKDDSTFCEVVCDDVIDCGARIDFDECNTACEQARNEARDIGGGACVRAHEDYLDCVIDDFCDGVGDAESACRLDAIDAEVEICGEFVGEF